MRLMCINNKLFKVSGVAPITPGKIYDTIIPIDTNQGIWDTAW